MMQDEQLRQECVKLVLENNKSETKGIGQIVYEADIIYKYIMGDIKLKQGNFYTASDKPLGYNV
jgi:hypothetical protein